MYLSIIFLPLLGSIVSGFFGRKVGIKGARLISSINVILTTVLAILAYIEIGFNNNTVAINLFEWISSESFKVIWGFYFDSLTVYFVAGAVLVLIIQLYKKIFIYNIKLYLVKKDLFLNFSNNKRYYSTVTCNNSIDKITLNSFDSNFLKWFVGFTDAEGNFIINPLLNNNKSTISTISFMFKIGLQPFSGSINSLNTINNSINIKGIRFHSNKISKENNTSLLKNFDVCNLDPNWVSGFTDAEGCFITSIANQSKGWLRTRVIFSIHLHIKDEHLLRKLKKYFKVGNVHIDKKSASFTVTKFEDIVNVIVPHFKNYPLRSAKSIDFNLWEQCVEIMKNKGHLTREGLNKILKLKSALNKGLPEFLKKNFKDEMVRPEFIVDSTPLDPNWVSGFVEGDGSFFVSVSEKTKLVRCFFSVKLDKRDTPLIEKLQEFFNGIGTIYQEKNTNIVQYNIVSSKHLYDLVLPQFDTYKFSGNKLSNYLIWKEILSLVKNKEHLTREGLNKIIDLKYNLNLWDY